MKWPVVLVLVCCVLVARAPARLSGPAAGAPAAVGARPAPWRLGLAGRGGGAAARLLRPGWGCPAWCAVHAARGVVPWAVPGRRPVAVGPLTDTAALASRSAGLARGGASGVCLAHAGARCLVRCRCWCVERSC